MLHVRLMCVSVPAFAAPYHHYDDILQVVQQKPIEAYRNTFANLALPLFAMAEPIPAKAFEYKELKWSIWDRWILEGDLTVQVGGCVGLGVGSGDN